MLADRDEVRLSEAVKVSMETQQMTPLIKEELRLSIMKKRHASGQEEIKVEFPEPQQYELTEHELMKRERRREQNRRAAQRCRQKKKRQHNGKHEVFSFIINENTSLQAEVKKLRKEKTVLGTLFKQHVMSGCCRQVPNEALSLLQPHVTPSPVILTSQMNYPCVVQDSQPLPLATIGQEALLPSFAETFLESVSPSSVDQDVFHFPPDQRNDLSSTRTWSGTSDDMMPTENLPDTIFDALDATSDDVFYDNEQLPVKMAPESIQPTMFQDSCNLDPEDNWSHLEIVDILCPDQHFDPSLLNEP